MNTKLVSIALILAIALLTAVSGAVLIQYFCPNIGIIGTHAELTVYIEDVLWTNNTENDWGTCEPGYIYLKELNVTNTGNTPLTVQVILEDLPPGWTLTWAHNNTSFAIGQSKAADLQLSIPSDATGWGTWGFWIRGLG